MESGSNRTVLGGLDGDGNWKMTLNLAKKIQWDATTSGIDQALRLPPNPSSENVGGEGQSFVSRVGTCSLNKLVLERIGSE